MKTLLGGIENIVRVQNNLHFKKTLLIKMTRKEQNKILNDKIEANNAQYNLERMNA